MNHSDNKMFQLSMEWRECLTLTKFYSLRIPSPGWRFAGLTAAGLTQTLERVAAQQCGMSRVRISRPNQYSGS